MTAEAFWLEATDPRWSEFLAASALHDVYHSPAYHRSAAAAGEGEPRLFVWREGDAFVALPLLLRSLATVPGLEGEVARDATSVYGYPGPVVSRAPVDAPMAARFRQALADRLAGEGIASLFSRLHPLIDEQTTVLNGLGELHTHGETVSIDLTLPEEEQSRRYRRDHRAGVRKLIAAGYAGRTDEGFAALDRFVDIYHDNMRRVDASHYYLFGRAYFDRLRRELADQLTLVVVEQAQELACAGLFLATDGIVQYHLSATAAAHLKAAPAKLMLDFARQRYSAQGRRVLHLGGGLGAKEDSLMLFKAGFSDRRHVFRTWRWVVLPDLYAALARRRDAARGPARMPAGFFPRYRG